MFRDLFHPFISYKNECMHNGSLMSRTALIDRIGSEISTQRWYHRCLHDLSRRNSSIVGYAEALARREPIENIEAYLGNDGIPADYVFGRHTLVRTAFEREKHVRKRFSGRCDH